jgi:photosystem II stability/assembly factor-like uncharacterized protein
MNGPGEALRRVRGWPQTPMSDSVRAVRMTAGGARGFTAGDQGLLLHTVDGGRSWQRQTCTSGGMLFPFTGVTTDATGELAWAVTRTGAVCITTDSGAVWTDQNQRCVPRRAPRVRVPGTKTFEPTTGAT